MLSSDKAFSEMLHIGVTADIARRQQINIYDQ
jgi:hypothetical protein